MPTPSEDPLAASRLMQSWSRTLPDASGDHPVRLVQLNLSDWIARLLSQHEAAALLAEQGPNGGSLVTETLEALRTARKLLDPTDETGNFLANPEERHA